MKALRLPCLVLSTLLLLSLWSGHLLKTRCDIWIAQVCTIDRAVAREDWPRAEKKLDALSRQWQGAQMYLSLVSHHRELDEAAALLRRCTTLLHEQDRQALRSHLADLADQLGYLAAAEQCSLHNIL